MTCHKHPHAHLVTVDDLAVDASGGRRCLWEDGNKALRAKERIPAGWQQPQQSKLMQDVGAEDGDAAVANRVPLQI